MIKRYFRTPAHSEHLLHTYHCNHTLNKKFRNNSKSFSEKKYLARRNVLRFPIVKRDLRKC